MCLTVLDDFGKSLLNYDKAIHVTHDIILWKK